MSALKSAGAATVYWGSIAIAILSFVIAIGHFTLMVIQVWKN